MKQNDWTSKLHERLDGHKATVPDGLWDKIAERLDDNIATAPAPLPYASLLWLCRLPLRWLSW